MKLKKKISISRSKETELEAIIDGESRLRYFFTERRIRYVKAFIIVTPILTAAGLWYMHRDSISERIKCMEKDNRMKRLEALKKTEIEERSKRIRE